MKIPSEQSHSMIPYLHVASVKASSAFYQLLGMQVTSLYGGEEDPFWARLSGEGGDIMLAKATGPIDPRLQAVLLYRYSNNVAKLREHLIASGLAESGEYQGDHENAFPPQGRVYAIHHPHHMENGELRLHDPDGYVILIGQLSAI